MWGATCDRRSGFLARSGWCCVRWNPTRLRGIPRISSFTGYRVALSTFNQNRAVAAGDRLARRVCGVLRRCLPTPAAVVATRGPHHGGIGRAQCGAALRTDGRCGNRTCVAERSGRSYDDRSLVGRLGDRASRGSGVHFPGTGRDGPAARRGHLDAGWPTCPRGIASATDGNPRRRPARTPGCTAPRTRVGALRADARHGHRR